jgi:hypothetical protein
VSTGVYSAALERALPLGPAPASSAALIDAVAPSLSTTSPAISPLHAALAVGAERDRLERRVADLELEVRQLRAVLGRVLQDVAGAMNTPDRSEPGKAVDTSSGAGS